MNLPLYNRLSAKVDLRHLRCAVAAADFRSLRQAADAMNIQQSTLSRLIAQLEHATSMKIFVRSTSGVIVSEIGAEFIQMARAVLEQIDEFEPSVEPSRRQSLRIGFSSSLSAGGLRTNLLDFRNRFPQFRLSMLERRKSRLSLKLQNGTLDIVICAGKLSSSFRTSPLWSERVLLALPEDHPLAGREVIYWTDLRSEVLLMSRHDPHSNFEDLVASKFVLHDGRPNIQHQDVSRCALTNLIGMNFGIGLVLESDVGAPIPSIVLRELRDGTGSASVQFSAFWQGANDNPALGKFLLLLKERHPISDRELRP